MSELNLSTFLFGREVLPHAPDAWIDAELRQVTARIVSLIGELSA